MTWGNGGYCFGLGFRHTCVPEIPPYCMRCSDVCMRMYECAVRIKARLTAPEHAKALHQHSAGLACILGIMPGGITLTLPHTSH